METRRDYYCAVARHHEIFFLWRHDLVLELAVKAGARFILTFNERAFAGCERFGIQALTPGDFLRRTGALP